MVSIITPTYNHEKYIADCINSVLAQNYQNWEMIIVDDGSTDNTYSIAKSFAENDNRISVFTQENIGIFRLCETYNFALAKSKGEYIAVLEGDDVWLPKKLQLQVAELERNKKAVLSFTQAYASSEDMSKNIQLNSFEHIGSDIKNNNPIGSLTQHIIFENFLPALSVVIRRESLMTIGGFKQPNKLPLVDLPTWIELSLLGEFCFISEPCAKWRVYPHQVTKTYTAEMWEGFYLHAMSFFAKHESFLSAKISKKELETFYAKKLVMAHSRSGRYKLIRKNFKDARVNYMKSIFDYGLHEPIWKLRSVIGLLFSFLHLDIEWLAKLIGRVSYK